MRRPRLALLMILGSVTPIFAQEPENWVLGIQRLHRLDLLPELHQSVYVGSVSSYDRTGGNDDGFSGKYSFVAKEDDGLVIADLEGPGMIHRIWTPTPTDDMLEFYFDGEATPRIRLKFRDLFLGRQAPFVSPLVGCGAGGFYSYVPLGYRKSCKVKLVGKRMQFYQINYARYPSDAPVETWNASPSDGYRQHHQKAIALLASAGKDVSSQGAPSGSECTTHRVRVSLEPGSVATLFEANQGGRMVGLRIQPAAALEGKARDLVLRMVWDGEVKPAVLCPAGDFFGYAWGCPAATSLLLGTVGEVCYCYFPMPFERSAKIELLSERKEGPPLEIQAEVVVAAAPRKPNEGKFYAIWRRENPTTKGVPFTFLEAQGRGHLVGCLLQAQGMESGNTYFFEGDDQTTLDGKLAIHGTGSEDFFNGGWYDVPGRWEKRLSLPLSGCLAYQKHLGRTGAYRLMLGDAYAFRSSIRQTIEHAPTENSLLTDYCGLTFVYLEGLPAWDQVLPPPEARSVVDFDRIVFTPSWAVPIHAFTFRGVTLTKKDEKIDGKDVGYFSMSAKGPDWVGPPFVSFICDIPASGRYAVSIDALKGPAQAKVQLFENDMPVGDAADMYCPQRQRSGPVHLGTLMLEEGPANLMFKLVGKNENAEGLGLDLVTIQCDRER